MPVRRQFCLIMEPIFVEVDRTGEAEYTDDQTHSLIRVHTDECLCESDADATMDKGPRKSLLELFNSQLPPQDSLEIPPTMCTDRLPGSYCPFGDATECDCLELFTSSLSPVCDYNEDPAYIEELLDELSSSLSDISDPDLFESYGTSSMTMSSNDSDNCLVTPVIYSQFKHTSQLTSTPVHRRSGMNPVLANIVSPVLDDSLTTDGYQLWGDEKPSTATRSQDTFGQYTDATASAINELGQCELDDSLELFGMAKLEETGGIVMTDGIRGENDNKWWALQGPYVSSLSQLVLPNTEDVEDSLTLFFD